MPVTVQGRAYAPLMTMGTGTGGAWVLAADLYQLAINGDAAPVSLLWVPNEEAPASSPAQGKDEA